jgi:hypothetical protein
MEFLPRAKLALGARSLSYAPPSPIVILIIVMIARARMVK